MNSSLTGIHSQGVDRAEGGREGGGHGPLQAGDLAGEHTPGPARIQDGKRSL